jgi:hypothetical protein
MYVCVQDPDGVSALGEGSSKIHGNSALAHSAFPTDDRNFVFNLAHSYPQGLLLHQHLLSRIFHGVCSFLVAH